MISLEAGSMTEMACDEPRMALESAYIAAVAGVTDFRFEDADLVLSGDDVALTFTEEVPMEPLSLEGTAWSLDSIAAGSDAVSSVVAGTEPTLLLDDGAASGSGGCNRFHGGYELEGAGLSFGPLATTKMACEEPAMTQEDTVLRALGSVATWSIEEDRLTLADANGDLLLGYTGEPA
jgi:heat shock protein HslJ